MTGRDLFAGKERQPRELTGRAVLIWLLGFFGVVIVANAVLVRAAVSTFGGVETESSYKAGLMFSREAAAAHAQDSLHWQVTAKVRPSGGERTIVEVVARDAQGRPLRGLEASAVLAHPADQRFDHLVSLTEQEPGKFEGVTAPIAGQWELVIELSRDGARLFRSRNRIVLQ